MSEILQICRDAALGFEGGVACGVYSLEGEALALFLREPELQPAYQDFVDLALGLLGEEAQAEMVECNPAAGVGLGPGELHLAGDIFGYARLLPLKRVLVVLAATPSNNVGIGWATLSVAATRVESAVLSRMSGCIPRRPGGFSGRGAAGGSGPPARWRRRRGGRAGSGGARGGRR